jgi:hypothetical protein
MFQALVSDPQRTYTVRTLADNQVILEHVADLGLAIDAYAEAWDDAQRGAIIVDDLDGQPACVVAYGLGCGCHRCFSEPANDDEPCPSTTPTGTAPKHPVHS